MIQTLTERNPVFAKIFNESNDPMNLTPAEERAARTDFESEYPDEDYESFVRIETESVMCPQLTFDPLTNRYSKMSVVAPSRLRKKQTADFDAFRFINAKQQRGESFPMVLYECDSIEDLLGEDRGRSNADGAIKCIARLADVLSKACNQKMLDLVSEKRVY